MRKYSRSPSLPCSPTTSSPATASERRRRFLLGGVVGFPSPRTPPSSTASSRPGLCGVGCLEQVPNAVFQQFDSPLKSAELSNPHDCDGQAQLKGRGA